MLRLLRFLMICRYVECLDTLFWKGLLRCQMISSLLKVNIRSWRPWSVGFPCWFFHGFSRVVPSSAVASSRLSRWPNSWRNSPWRRRKPEGIPEFQLGKYYEIHVKTHANNMQNMCFFQLPRFYRFTNHGIVGQSKIFWGLSREIIMETIDPIIDFLTNMFESGKD